MDGATLLRATLEPYDGGFTFDLLPDGPTGVYIADGIPLDSMDPARMGRVLPSTIGA